MKKYNVAILGIRGAVGQCMYRIVKERKFPVNKLILISPSGAGGQLDGHRYVPLTKDVFNGVDIVLSSPGAEISKIWAPIAAKAGAVVIDNTSQFRMDPDVPLVVPEVNPEDIKKHKGIIANPNCSTIQMVVALNPIHKKVGIKRIIVTTLQASSGAGKGAVEQLKEETNLIAQGGFDNIHVSAVNKTMPQQLAYNCFPHIGSFVQGDYTNEEWKLVHETHKIMHAPKIRISATTVRVPVRTGHSESIYIQTVKPITVAELKKLLAKAPGVMLIDEPKNNLYPMPKDAEGRDETFVGRIRQDAFDKKGFWLWVVADNLRKGAATNAVQIAECVISSLE